MTRKRKNRIRVAALIVIGSLALAVALPGAAGAATGDPSSDPTAAQYADPTIVGGSSGETSEEGNGGGSLPFTGLDIAAMAAVALALTGVGFALRRLTPDPEA